MYDQVSTLRRLVGERDQFQKRNMRVIAVTSGKGGVGKTNLVVNLALALAENNYKIIVLDGDLGLANIDITFGITPKYSIKHLLAGEKRIEEILYPVNEKILVLPGASGVMEMANLDRGQLKNVIVNFGRLEKMADILLIDTGAGLGYNVVNFICSSDDVIVVMTPEPTSMTDAYGLIKNIKTDTQKINVNVVVNRVNSEIDARQTFERLDYAVKKFLGIPLNLLGWIYEDPLVGRSVMEQKPLGVFAPESKAYKCIQWIAGNVVGIYLRPPTQNSGIRGFISSLLKAK